MACDMPRLRLLSAGAAMPISRSEESNPSPLWSDATGQASLIIEKKPAASDAVRSTDAGNVS